MAMPPLHAITLGGGGEEDRFTYVLASLLQHERVARAFTSNVLGIQVAPSSPVVADIQQVVGDGRVDLRLSGTGFYAIIEVKLTAWLHGDQIPVYARHLAPRDGGRLFLLAPSATLLGMQADAQAQVAALAPAPEASVVVAGLTWQSVADFLRHLPEHDPELPSDLRVYLRDFASVVYADIEGDRRPFTDEEAKTIQTAYIADYTERLEIVLVDVLKQLRLAFPGSSNKIGAALGFLGGTIKVGGYWAWFGMPAAAWREQGRTPYWIQTLPSAITQHWEALAHERGLPLSIARRGRAETLIPVLLRDRDRSLDSVTATVVERATAILTALPDAYRAAGMTQSSDPVLAPAERVVAADLGSDDI
jgi:hypothetical protein